jgi:hypothetical protein
VSSTDAWDGKQPAARLQTNMAANIWEQKDSQHWTLDLSTLTLKTNIVFQPLKIVELESFLCSQIQTFRDTETTHKVCFVKSGLRSFLQSLSQLYVIIQEKVWEGAKFWTSICKDLYIQRKLIPFSNINSSSYLNQLFSRELLSVLYHMKKYHGRKKTVVQESLYILTFP